MRTIGHRLMVRELILGLAVSSLASCGGGGGGSAPGGGAPGSPPSGGDSVAGIYIGTNLLRCDVQAMLALVTEEGRVVDFHSVGAQMDYGAGLAEIGDVDGLGPVHAASVTEYRSGGPSLLTQVAVDTADAAVRITSLSRQGLAVAWPGRSAEFCTDTKKTLSRNAELYNRAASFAKVAGVYSSAGNAQSGYSIALSIDADGQLTGSDSQGCVMNGSVTVPHANRNYYSMAATVDSCPSEGNYSGEALLADGMNGGQDNLLLLALVRDAQDLAVVQVLSR